MWQDTLRLIDPNRPSYGDLSADNFIAFLLGGPDFRSGRNEFVTYWQALEYPHEAIHRGAIAPLKTWEKLTRFDGPWMVVLLVLCLAAPWVGVGEARRGARLLCATTLVLLFFPLFTKGYDYRFVIPVFGPLFATATLAAWGLSSRVAGRLRRRRARSCHLERTRRARRHGGAPRSRLAPPWPRRRSGSVPDAMRTTASAARR